MTNKITFAALVSAATLFAGAASASTVLGDFNTTLTATSSYDYEEFDINGDNLNDFFISLSPSSIGRATIGGTLDYEFASGAPAGQGIPINVSDTKLLFKDVNGVAALWSAGDVISAANGISTNSSAGLYGSAQNAAYSNLLPNVGDSGYYGFVTQLGAATGDLCDGLCSYAFDGTPTTIFSFVKVEHGSVILSTFGTNANGAAAIPGGGPLNPVPLPASALMLLAGLGGFGALRRKRT